MNTRKRKYTTTILATALLFSLGGCVKDELHDTPHPDTGKVTVTVDWSDRGEGVDIPAEWTVTGRLYRHGDRCDPLAGLSFQSGQLYPCGV